jgi:LysM repeat protein
MWKISVAYHISLDALIAANPQISDPNMIYVGQAINIPIPCASFGSPARLVGPDNSSNSTDPDMSSGTSNQISILTLGVLGLTSLILM